jgi:hypothetical protein
MATLERHGELSWVTAGADRRVGPYAIVWGPRGHMVEMFGKVGARRSGSQAQLKAYYQSAAAWWTLHSLPASLFEDKSQATTIVRLVGKTAVTQMNVMARSRREFDTREYNAWVQSESNKRIAQYVQRSEGRRASRVEPTPPEPERHDEKLSWRTAASGRMDAFSSHGSYHISTPTPRGYQLRWLWKDQGAALGEFRTVEEAKRVAEMHHERMVANTSAAAEPGRRRYRRR